METSSFVLFVSLFASGRYHQRVPETWRAAASVMTIDVMSFDHPIEGLAVDGENTRRRLFVPTSVFQHTGNITSFDFGERDPVVVDRPTWCYRAVARCSRVTHCGSMIETALKWLKRSLSKSSSPQPPVPYYGYWRQSPVR